MWYVIKEDELYHHGIKGQKWGVRRFQNPDGTLTDAGKKRYGGDKTIKSPVKSFIKNPNQQITDYKPGNVVSINQYDPAKVEKGTYGYQQTASLQMGKNNVKVRIDLHDDATDSPITKEAANEYFNRINKLTRTLSSDDTQVRKAIAEDIYTSDLGMSKSKFMNAIKPLFVETWLRKDGRQQAFVWYDDADMLGGHVLEAVVDLKSGDVDYVMMEG